MSTALSEKVDECLFHNFLRLFVLEFLPVSFHLSGEYHPESFLFVNCGLLRDMNIQSE